MSDDYVPLAGAAHHPDVIEEAERPQAIDPEFEEWLADRDTPRVVKVTELRPNFHHAQGIDLSEPRAYLRVTEVTPIGDGSVIVSGGKGGRTIYRRYAPSDRVWTLDPAEVSDLRDAHHDTMHDEPTDPRDYL